MCSGYALIFYDAVVSSDAALACTMFDQFPRSYGRKMQPMTPVFPKKCTFFEKNCIFFQKYLVMCSGYASHFTTQLYLRTPPWSALCLTNSPEATVAKCSP